MTSGTDPDLQLLTAPPQLRLDGRVVWITGASRGLGRALAFAFAGAGAELLLSARSVESLEEVATAIRAAGAVVHTCAGSVTDPDHLFAARRLAADTWGRLDVLVNNAGISPSFDRAERLDPHVLTQTLEVNLTGALRCAQAAFPLLCESTAASVVNVSSIHGRRAHERLLAYASSKGGLELMSRTLALEWAAHAIRVNCVAPGYVETDMTADLLASDRHREALLARIPLGRFATPREITGAVLFLAGEVSGFVTGATLTIDGGWSAR